MYLKEIKKKLTKQEKTISVVESLTAGHLQTLLSKLSGSSSFFEGGLTLYSMKQKNSFLNIDNEKLLEANSVSEEIADLMAVHTCELFCTDYAIATTGYAECSPDDGVEIPFAYVAIYSKESGNIIFEDKIECPNRNRNEVQKYIAETVLKEFSEII
jgi:nicotinamide-nucleotide amidase